MEKIRRKHFSVEISEEFAFVIRGVGKNHWLLFISGSGFSNLA